MWAVILLILWVIFVLIASAPEKFYNKLGETKNQREEEFERKYCFSREEGREFIESCKKVYGDKVKHDKIEKELKEEAGILYVIEPYIILAYFAKKGKAPSSGFLFIGDEGCSKIFDKPSERAKNGLPFFTNPTPSQVKIAKQDVKDFVIWYDKTLRENGFPYEIMCAPPYGQGMPENWFDHRKAKPLHLCENFDECALFWAPSNRHH